MRLPSPEQISSMKLVQINKEIIRIAAQLNKNLKKLKEYTGKYNTESAIDYQEKMAGAATPNRADPLGMARKFSLAKEKDIKKARKRLAILIKAASSKKGTIRKLQKSEKQRKESLAKHTGIKSFSDDEYVTLIDTFNKMKEQPGYDSEQVLDAFALEHEEKMFTNVKELQDFIEEKGTRGDLLYQMDKMSEYKQNNPRVKYKKNQNGEWKLTTLY